MLENVEKQMKHDDKKGKKRVSSARSHNKILREEKKFLNQIKNLDDVISR